MLRTVGTLLLIAVPSSRSLRRELIPYRSRDLLTKRRGSVDEDDADNVVEKDADNVDEEEDPDNVDEE